MELNTFFVKHIFPMPTEHPICVTRILLMGLMAAPATRYALCSMHRPEQTKILIDIHLLFCMKYYFLDTLDILHYSLESVPNKKCSENPFS